MKPNPNLMPSDFTKMRNVLALVRIRKPNILVIINPILSLMLKQMCGQRKASNTAQLKTCCDDGADFTC